MDNILTNQEKIELLQNRLLIINQDIFIINKEIEFYQSKNLDEKIQISLNKLNKKEAILEVLKIELNNMFSIIE